MIATTFPCNDYSIFDMAGAYVPIIATVCRVELAGNSRSTRARCAAVPLLVGAMLVALAGAPSAEAHPFLGAGSETGAARGELSRVAGAGAGFVRAPLRWQAIQAAPGRCRARGARSACRWRAFDRLVGGARKLGLDVLVEPGGLSGRISSRGAWASLTAREVKRLWRRFLAAAAARYSGDALTWVLAEDLRAATAEIAALDPGARLIAHAGSLESDDDGAAVADAVSLAYARPQVAARLSGIGVHARSLGASRLVLPLETTRAALDAAAPGRAQTISITDLGYSSTDSPAAPGLGPARQAESLARSIELLARNRTIWGIDRVGWTTWRDAAEDHRCVFCRSAGLVTEAGAKKPALAAFRQLAREIDSLPLPVPGAQAGGFVHGIVEQGSPGVQDLALMRSAGAEVTRVLFNWPGIQPHPGDCTPALGTGACDWNRTDRLVGAAAAAGMEVLPFLSGTPDYAGATPHAPPVGSAGASQSWTDFVDAVVRRYGPNGAFWHTEFASTHPGTEPLPIRRWQIWNEPGSPTAYEPAPGPLAYADLLALTAPVIRAADPNAEILTGGLAGSPRPESGGITSAEFVAALYAHGAAPYFDAIALHPYSSDVGGIGAQLDRVRERVVAAGEAGDSIWVTEVGYASEGSPRNPFVKGSAGQAKTLTATFDLLEGNRERWNLGGVIWFARQDTIDPLACPFCPGSGLFALDGTPKPAFGAYQQAAAP